MPEALPLSALQHFLYCPRQCALIHIEHEWMENRYTAEGRLMHSRVDGGSTGRRDGISQDRAVPVRSNKLGLYGVVDMLEMHPEPNGSKIPFLVEYKRGRPKIEDWDRAQLCAQAICLEEMLDVTIYQGAIFYGQPRRREKVFFDSQLRKTVSDACRQMHDMIGKSETPPPSVKRQRCKNCSLTHLCLPGLQKHRRVESYLLKGLDG
jgi:CRISPR-associated exonuclease Cas4